MTQFDNPYANPYTDPMIAPRKTSGLAITALVFSLIFCCPLTTLLGPILGLVALVTIGSNPAKKGKGLAWSAIIIGVLLTLGWVGFGFWGYESVIKPMKVGPKSAMEAAFAGNVSGFKGQLFGQSAAASDDEVKAFTETLRKRFGEFRTCHADEATMNARGPDFENAMSPIQNYPYIFQFSNKMVKGDVELAWVDPQTGQFEGVKFGRMVLVDPDTDEEIVFPPGSQPTANPSKRSSRPKPAPTSGNSAPAQSAPGAESEPTDGG